MDKGEITLITFSNTIHKTKTYQNIGLERENLINELKSEKYDGGTNLQSIDFSYTKRSTQFEKNFAVIPILGII